LRVAWNKNNQYYIAVIEFNQNEVTLIDTRKKNEPVIQLKHH